MRAFLQILLSAAVAASPAFAGTISISIGQSAELKDQTLAVKVTIRNSGDEAAQSVTPVLRFRDKEARGQSRPSLEPNTTMEETLTVPVGQLGEGRWAYRLSVDYTDLNQYPFQALEVQSVAVGSPPPAKIAVPPLKLEGGLSGSGDLEVAVKNLTADTRNVTLLVALPEGLEAAEPQQTLQVAGWGEEQLEVGVTNRTALAGSKYPVFAIAEYDDGPVHHAVVGRGIVEIVGESASGLAAWRPWLLWGAGALVAAWVAVVALRTVRS